MRRVLTGLVLCCLATTTASAQSITIGDMTIDFADPALAAKDAVQTAFVAAFKAAKASRDPGQLAALVHPASRACMTSPVAKAYFDERMQRDVAAQLPDDAKFVFLSKTTNAKAFDQLAARGDLTTLPVQPTEIIGIDFTREERDAKGVLLKHTGSTIVRQLARHEGKLMLVEYCLTAKGEDAFARKGRAGQPVKP